MQEAIYLEIPQGVDVLGETEVRDFDDEWVPAGKKQVLGFEVPVNDSPRMDVLKRCQYMLRSHGDCGAYCKSVAYLTRDSLSLRLDCRCGVQQRRKRQISTLT